MSSQQPYLVQLGVAQTAVVRALFDSLSRDGWTSCTVEYHMAGRVAESRVSLTGTGATTETTEIVKSPLTMITALKRLRELMAGQGPSSAGPMCG